MAFLFGKKKKEEKIPELPELPELPPLPELTGIEKEKPELPPLPSFPSSLIGERITHEAVKHAIKAEEESLEEFEPAITPMTREIEENELKRYHPPKIKAIKEITREVKPVRIEPLFVRIDRYQDSLSNLQEVKKRLLEIENLLGDIKEIKTKEEMELQRWENEIQEAKSKLNKIDRTIFQKLEE